MSGIASIMTEQNVIKVCIPHTYRECFDYECKEEAPPVGARVWVPFRKQNRVGLVIGKGRTETKTQALRTIISIIDEQALLSTSMLSLCQWISRYYQAPLSEIISLALPKKLRIGEQASLPLSTYYQLALTPDKARELLPRKSTKKEALIDFLAAQGRPTSKKTLTQAGFHKALLVSLSEQSIITHQEQVDLPNYHGTGNDPFLTLNKEQALAVATITEHQHHYHCFMLQGVTGSGKTEVYLHVIAQVLNAGKQVLVLVPEIGLTPQLLARFSARFSQPMVVIHSGLNESERSTAWLAANSNQVKLVIGTRSAMFTPLPSLGLIIIDEEHDTSLKQMDGVRYSARDSALMRAYMANIPIILGSATPSLESLHNCHQGKYTRLRLTQKALDSAPLAYQIMDMRNQTIEEGLALSTLDKISQHLANHHQVLVFINRRGFAPILLCHACGWMVDCRACDSHLTMHRSINRLICHHCGLHQPLPRECKHCQGHELIPIGTGTQRLYDFLSKRFPDTCLLRIDRDEVRKKHELDARLQQINTGEAQLIIGTQMLAKGHHFPNLTLVVVVDADSGFYNQDFRALEQLGQLLTQVAGRAGRAAAHGQVIIQTHLPHHPILNSLIQQGYDTFATELLNSRQQAALPPWQYLAVIRAEDKQIARVMDLLQTMKRYLCNYKDIQVLGPAPAPLARKAHQHRMQLLLKATTRKPLQMALTSMREWLTINKLCSNVRWNVDVDPQDLS